MKRGDLDTEADTQEEDDVKPQGEDSRLQAGERLSHQKPGRGLGQALPHSLRRSPPRSPGSQTSAFQTVRRHISAVPVVFVMAAELTHERCLNGLPIVTAMPLADYVVLCVGTPFPGSSRPLNFCGVIIR